MATTIRDELLEVLGDISRGAPEIRFGQLIAQLSYMARDVSSEAIGVAEDEEMLRAAKLHLEQLRQAAVVGMSDAEGG